MVKIAEKQKVLKELILDTGKATQKADWLFSKIEQAEEYVSQTNYPNLLSDEELKEIKNPNPNGDLGKAVLAVKNNGIDLTNLITFEERKREEKDSSSHSLKKKLLDTLPEWTVCGGEEGAFLNGKESDIRPGGTINDDDYQEVKRAITESIKQKADEWLIENTLVAKGKGAYAYKQKDVLLIHKSFVPKYDSEYGQLIVKYGKVHWKSGFSDHQWAEIEQAISQSWQQSQQVEQSKNFPFPSSGFDSSSNKH